MRKYIFWVIIILISLFSSFILKFEEFQGQPGEIVVASILGFAFGALIFPAILTLIVGGVYKLFKKEFGKKSFRATFLIAWIIILPMSFIGNIIGDSTTTSQINDIGKYTYEPGNNEYSVTFINKPEISENIFLETPLISETAELLLPSAQSMLRAESFVYSEEIDGNLVDEETIRTILEEYCTANGLTHSELRFQNSLLGKKAAIRAFKTLKDNNNNDINVTYGIEAYFGVYSGIILTGASISSSYPSTEIIDFFNSINRIN